MAQGATTKVKKRKPSVLKRARQSHVRAEINRANRTRVRTIMKRLRTAIAAKDGTTAGTLLQPTLSAIDRAITVRRRFIMVRTRVRFARLISARTWDCLARLRTEGLRFFTLVVAPCAIQNLLFLLCAGEGFR